MKYNISIILTVLLTCACTSHESKIDREALVLRNSPVVQKLDPLSSLSIGNGHFAFTVDATGLQTFPEIYSEGVPLGTQSNWGWHSFPNDKEYQFEETLESYDFGHKEAGFYSVQPRIEGTHSPDSSMLNRKLGAANYFRSNPHRLHIGIVGLELLHDDGTIVLPEEIMDIHQKMDMWNGRIESQFTLDNIKSEVVTFCHPDNDIIITKVSSELLKTNRAGIKLRFPYPTGLHSDDGCDWKSSEKHMTQIIEQDFNSAILKREIDSTIYFVKISWDEKATLREKAPHYFVINTEDEQITLMVEFAQTNFFSPSSSFQNMKNITEDHWRNFWKEGGAVDFSECTDYRAKELERRVVLSQYLTAIQCAASEPPQETGLTYNSWFGKFHLEMHWWHGAHFPLWNREHLLAKSMGWYQKVEPIAKGIAERQHFDGIRWMKMTDPSGNEAPSSIGSFLIWQQPHFIYLSELIYRQDPSQETLSKYIDLVLKSASFMASFATPDIDNNRYILKGLIPAQETLRPDETINPPFELSYWHFGLSTAQKWRERADLERDSLWDLVIENLSPLAAQDGLYLAAESAPQTYTERRFTSDHMAVLGALGILPMSPLVDSTIMLNTCNWVLENWNWNHTWGWDYPMTAMCATRMGQPKKAVDALLMDQRTNTYLINGHNYQNESLRIYLPGNGGLLTAVALMCAGWDGCNEATPGFPKDGRWNVKWEGLSPMP